MNLWIVFPLSGLFGRSRNVEPKFTYFSITTALNILFLTATSIESTFIVRHWVKTGFGIDKGFMMLFIFTSVMISGELHRMAKRWPAKARLWSVKEAIFRNLPYRQPEINLKRQFMTVTMLTFIGQAILSSLYIWWSYDNAKTNLIKCQYPSNASVTAYLHVRERPYLFGGIKFKIWMAPFFQLEYFIIDLGWIFSQNLVIFLSMWITTRFKQLHDRIQMEISTCSKLYWHEIHDHFNQLVDLVADVDQEFGNTVIMTCSTRLLLICYDVFKVTR